MNLIGAFILIVLITIVLGASRRVALIGMMAGVLYLTQAQQVQVFGFNLFAFRFLELAGFIRVMARREFSFRQLNGIDRALLLLYGYTTVVFLLRSTEGAANQIGEAVDAFLCYFTFRGLLSDMEDFRWFLRAFLILLAPYTLLVLVERFTGHNPFAFLGGIIGGSEWMRNGSPRCYGTFRQPDTLGMFAASFIPLFVGMACIAKERKRAIFGICLCLAIVVAANSGGPAAAAAAVFFCWGLWGFRTRMQKVRWSIVGLIALLAMVMKAPIWYIFARASVVTGGNGWHRSFLIDVAYRHISQWWFAGMPLSKTLDWFSYQNAVTESADITNFYIELGLKAGLGAIALLILLLTRTYSNLGRALAVARSSSQRTSGDQFLLWGLGGVLLIHIIDWFGITYFDQIYVIWFMQLATISLLTEKQIQIEPVELKSSCGLECKAYDTAQASSRL